MMNEKVVKGWKRGGWKDGRERGEGWKKGVGERMEREGMKEKG